MRSETLVKTIKTALYIIVALVPLVFFTQVIFPANVPKIFVFQVGIEFILACYLALLVFDFKRFRPRFSPILWALLAFIFTVVLSGFLGVDPARSFWSIIDREFGVFGLLHFAALIVILRSIGGELNWKRVWITSLLSSVLVSVVGIGQQFGVQLVSSTIFDPTSRPGSFFGNASYMAGYLLFNFFIGLWFMSDTKERWQKWLYGLSSVLMAFAILAAQSIADILGLAAGLLILLVFWTFNSSGRRRTTVIIFLGILLFGSGAVYLTRHSDFWQKVPGISRVVGFSFSQSDVKDRTIAWEEAIQGSKERPILGWGFENFNIPFDKHYNPAVLFVDFTSTFWDKPHNIFLEYLVTGGIVGLLAYLSLLGVSFWVIWKLFVKKREEKSAWPIFFLAMFASYVIQNATTFDTIGTYLMFALFLAFVDSEWQSHRRPIPETVNNPSIPSAKFWGTLAVAMLVITPLYVLNINTLRITYYNYWGIDYYVLARSEDSMNSWQAALSISNPYKYNAEKDFASTVQQALQQGMSLPDPVAARDQVITAMNEVISLHPQNYFYPLAFGDIYNTFYSSGLCGTECLDKADEMTAKAFSLSPTRQQIYYVLARTKILRGDLAGAIQAFKDAIALNPPSADPHFFYGILLLQAGDIQNGQKEIELAKELGRAPKDANEAMNLGILLGDKAGDYKEAAEYLKIAVDYADKSATPLNQSISLNARLRLALAYYFAKMFPESRSTFIDLEKLTNLKNLSVWNSIEPILIEVGAPLPN